METEVWVSTQGGDMRVLRDTRSCKDSKHTAKNVSARTSHHIDDKYAAASRAGIYWKRAECSMTEKHNVD